MSETAVDVPAPSATPWLSKRRRDLLMATALFLGALLVYGTTFNTGNVCLDVWSANYASWHWVTAGNPWIEGVRIPTIYHNEFRSVWIVRAANGHTVIGRPPGDILATLPAYLIFRPQQMSLLPGGVTAAFVTACSVTLMHAALRTRLTSRRALVGALAFGFATPVWSVAADAFWPHTLTVLSIAGMSWGAATGRWWLVGLFGGIGVWARLHFAVIVAVLGLFLAFRRRESGIALRIGAVGLVSVVLLSVWVHEMYGTWNPLAYQSGGVGAGESVVAGSHNGLVNQLGLWISPDRGILVWTPVIMVLLAALVRGWRDLPDWARALFWGGLAYTILQGRINVFSGGDPFYGYRLGLEFVACATPALVMTSVKMGRTARRIVGPVLAAQFFVISIGAISDSYFVVVDRVWHDNAFLLAVRAQPGMLVILLIVIGATAGVHAVAVRQSLAQQDPDLPAHQPDGPSRALT